MTLDEVDGFATGLPDVVVGTKWGNRTWMVGSKGFAWQRPFSKADMKRFGNELPPAGDILAVTVGNLDAKDALLAIAPRGFFTIPHFNGYPAVLIALREARASDVRAALVDAWRTVAPAASVAKRTVAPAASVAKRTVAPAASVAKRTVATAASVAKRTRRVKRAT